MRIFTIIKRKANGCVRYWTDNGWASLSEVELQDNLKEWKRRRAAERKFVELKHLEHLPGVAEIELLEHEL
jgi:hypothetical protein